MKKALHVLLVEDNAMDARLLRQMFSKEAAGSFHLAHRTRMSDAEAYLAQGEVDIVLLDMGLPDGQGIENLRRARAAAPGVVIMVLTGLDDEEMAAAAMKEGAEDYLIKGQIENRALPRALRHAMEHHRLQVETDSMRDHQLKLRDQFLSHVSHELRSPLTSIYSFTTIIADGLAGETSPQQDDYLQIVLRNVHQLRTMIEGLLEVTQTKTGELSIELEPVDVDEAVAYAVNALKGVASTKEIALTSHCCAGLPLAYANTARVRQVLTIVLDNAMKFTPNGGRVNVEARLHEINEGQLLVEVSDTGCGIRAEAIERIFDHLYQVTDVAIESCFAGRRGLGLGLQIARDLMTRLGGEIWAASELGKGSQFFLTLPVLSNELGKTSEQGIRVHTSAGL
jgi:signal transduction histidine kinase